MCQHHLLTFSYVSENEMVLLNKEFILEQVKATVCYPDEFVSTAKPEESKAKIFVMQGDCVEAALWVKNTFNSRPAVLDMANRTIHHHADVAGFTAGGGYLDGAGAQEENLHRRSNLHLYLADPGNVYRSERKWDYPIPDFGGIYASKYSVKTQNYSTILRKRPWVVSLKSLNSFEFSTTQLIQKMWFSFVPVKPKGTH